jgi:hypothetical protein
MQAEPVPRLEPSAGTVKRRRDEIIRMAYSMSWAEWVALGAVIAHAKHSGEELGPTAKEIGEAGNRMLDEVFDSKPLCVASTHGVIAKLERARFVRRSGSPPYRFAPTLAGLSRWREGG